MDLTMFEWVYLFTSFFSTYTLYNFMKVFYRKRIVSRRIEILVYIVTNVAASAVYLFFQIPILTMFSALATFFIVGFLYESTIKKKLLATVLIYLILVCVEVLSVIVSGSFNYTVFSAAGFDSIFGLLTNLIIAYFVALLFGNFKNIKNGEPVESINWVCIFLIPSSSIYLILMLFEAHELSETQVFIGVALIMIVNVTTFYLFDTIKAALAEKLENVLIREQNKYYNHQFELMSSSVQASKAIRHDIKNHVTVMLSFVAPEKKDVAYNYVSRITSELDLDREYASTGNVVIDSILNFKLQEANQNEIKVSLELNVPPVMEIAPFDFTVILGNLLDNAICATRSEIADKRFINIKIAYSKGRLFLKMDNYFTGEIKEINGILVSLQEDTENHGLGMVNIKRVVDKYNGTVDYRYQDKIFSLSLLLYAD